MYIHMSGHCQALSVARAGQEARGASHVEARKSCRAKGRGATFKPLALLFRRRERLKPVENGGLQGDAVVRVGVVGFEVGLG